MCQGRRTRAIKQTLCQQRTTLIRNEIVCFSFLLTCGSVNLFDTRGGGPSRNPGFRWLGRAPARNDRAACRTEGVCEGSPRLVRKQILTDIRSWPLGRARL